MNIIVIGSQGFIGSHLCDYFVETGNTVYGADIAEMPANAAYTYIMVSRFSDQWEELLRSVDLDICINAAGSGNVSYSITHPLIDFEANTLDVIKILDALRKYRPGCKYLHISSAAVYGNPSSLPVSEKAKPDPISPYGFHKMMSEALCHEYHKLFRLSVAIVRPFSIFGEGLRKQLLWDLCNKLKENKPVTLFGTGNETRDFIHISDFMQLTEVIINSGTFSGEVYNAASGSEISIRKISEIFEKHFGNNGPIHFNGESKPGDPVNWLADITAVKKLGFVPKANFEVSVVQYINWFKQLHEVR